VQWKIDQPPSLKRERTSLEEACLAFDARSEGQPLPLLLKGIKNWKGLARRPQVDQHGFHSKKESQASLEGLLAIYSGRTRPGPMI
jgi:hypothetical protein